MKKLKSLSIFFPFYNDAGTVEKAISDAYFYGKRVAVELEVIALHGGASKDSTWDEILKQKRRYKKLIILDKQNNWERYAVIKYGFLKATKEWVFYTDGDLQYHLDDLEKLVRKQETTNADLVNGFKINRGDRALRTFLGNIYQIISGKIFHLPIQDLTCDFRLIRRGFLKKIKLGAHDASILPELITKLEKAGATFAEVPVVHTKRSYGKSTYPLTKLITERVLGDFRILRKLRR